MYMCDFVYTRYTNFCRIMDSLLKRVTGCRSVGPSEEVRELGAGYVQFLQCANSQIWLCPWANHGSREGWPWSCLLNFVSSGGRAAMAGKGRKVEWRLFKVGGLCLWRQRWQGKPSCTLVCWMSMSPQHWCNTEHDVRWCRSSWILGSLGFSLGYVAL